MVKVLHIVGRNFEEIKAKNDEYIFMDGDVYIVDNQTELYIWRGQDCGVDEQTSGAWVANKIDNQDRGGEPSVYSFKQGEESDEFKNLIRFKVIDDDTPGFLKNAEFDMVEYKLFRVFTKEETASFDEAFIEEVKLDKSSLKSNDVFMLDGNEAVWLWIGNKANREEKIEGQKLMQKIDADRNYLPLQYTIYEDEGGKSEKAFYDFLKKVKGVGPVVSVEDQRELEFVAEESKTADEHKKDVNKKFKDAEQNDPNARKTQNLLTVDDVSVEDKDKLSLNSKDMDPSKLKKTKKKPRWKFW